MLYCFHSTVWIPLHPKTMSTSESKKTRFDPVGTQRTISRVGDTFGQTHRRSSDFGARTMTAKTGITVRGTVLMVGEKKAGQDFHTHVLKTDGKGDKSFMVQIDLTTATQVKDMDPNVQLIRPETYRLISPFVAHLGKKSNEKLKDKALKEAAENTAKLIAAGLPDQEHTLSHDQIIGFNFSLQSPAISIGDEVVLTGVHYTACVDYDGVTPKEGVYLNVAGMTVMKTGPGFKCFGSDVFAFLKRRLLQSTFPFVTPFTFTKWDNYAQYLVYTMVPEVSIDAEGNEVLNLNENVPCSFIRVIQMEQDINGNYIVPIENEKKVPGRILQRKLLGFSSTEISLVNGDPADQPYDSGPDGRKLIDFEVQLKTYASSLVGFTGAVDLALQTELGQILLPLIHTIELGTFSKTAKDQIPTMGYNSVAFTEKGQFGLQLVGNLAITNIAETLANGFVPVPASFVSEMIQASVPTPGGERNTQFKAGFQQHEMDAFRLEHLRLCSPEQFTSFHFINERGMPPKPDAYDYVMVLSKRIKDVLCKGLKKDYSSIVDIKVHATADVKPPVDPTGEPVSEVTNSNGVKTDLLSAYGIFTFADEQLGCNHSDYVAFLREFLDSAYVFDKWVFFYAVKKDLPDYEPYTPLSTEEYEATKAKLDKNFEDYKERLRLRDAADLAETPAEQAAKKQKLNEVPK
jgi:hypothetical protein